MQHFIDMTDFTPQWFDRFYDHAADIVAHPNAYGDKHRGKVLASLFLEPSTRTNFSFQGAMLRLGGSVFGSADGSSTSAEKGESFPDTIRTVSSYADSIVLRTPWAGSALAATLFSTVPVINAGDGAHLHPTQTLTDLVTIRQKRGGLDGMHIGFCGDLRYGRTVHALVEALAHFPNIRYTFVAPDTLQVPDYLTDTLDKAGQSYQKITNLAEAIHAFDVLYMTRLQKERISGTQDPESITHRYVLDRDMLSRAPKDCLVLHPLPRTGEICLSIDGDPRALYFDQVKNGMYARMALLDMMLSAPPLPAPPLPYHDFPPICRQEGCITRHVGFLPNLTAQSAKGTRCQYCSGEIR